MNFFIVKDSEAMRESPRASLSEFHDIKIVGYAADEAAAIEQYNLLFPEVVILDLNLQSVTGVAVLNNIKKHHGKITAMVLSNCNGGLYADACKHTNANYFVDKSFQFMEVPEVFLCRNRTSQLNKKYDGKRANSHGKFWIN